MAKTIQEYIKDFKLPENEAKILTIIAEEYNVTSVDFRQTTSDSYGASYQGVKEHVIGVRT